MGKVMLNFTDPFGGSPHALNVDGKISIKEVTRLLAEELGCHSASGQVIGGLFKNELSTPVIYDPKVGVLPLESPLNSFDSIKNNTTLFYYTFPPSALTLNDIFLENNIRLRAVSLAVTVEVSGNYYPVLLPIQNSVNDVSLVRLIFAQLKQILGIQFMPQGWQTFPWQILNARTGERIDGGYKGTLEDKVHHGDLLRLLQQSHNEQDEIVILDEKNDHDSDELEIKIGDDLLDSIIIEQEEPKKINQCIIELLQGDITLQEVDVIVNAAKPTLLGGGGVDGAIHLVAGPSLVKSSQILAPCTPGKAVLTPGFCLPAKWVLHAVGPIYKDGKQGEEQALAGAYNSCITFGLYSGFHSMAFPAISIGAYGYPADQAAKISWKAISDSLQKNKDGLLSLVRVVVFDEQTYDAYASALKDLL